MTSYESTTTRMLHQELNACPLIEDLLPLYIEGEVSPATRDLMVEHLAHCDHCAGFLAGAQSTRMQLRRESDARVQVLANDRPARLAVSKSVSFFRNLVELALGTMFVGFSGAIWSELVAPLQMLGTVLAMIFFLTAVAMIHRRGALGLAPILKLGACCVAAGIGAVSILGIGDPPMPFFGLLLAIGSVAGVRYLTGDGIGKVRV